jgi:hypothetical protein
VQAHDALTTTKETRLIGKTTVAAIAATLLLAAPAAAAGAGAGDSYYLSKSQAERNVRDAAETLYNENYGIVYEDTGAWCRPQGAKRARRGFVYHRWVCTWAGRDWEGDTAYGAMRVTGHSGNRYGYKVLRGIHWPD